ncbi:hypothetical protein D1872_253110 [compost metagenome]
MPRRPSRPDDEDFRQSFRPDDGFHLRMLEDRLGLGGKDQRPVKLAVKQRFDAEPVAGETNVLSYAVPDRESEDAIQPVNAIRPPLDVGLEQYLRIAVCPE